MLVGSGVVIVAVVATIGFLAARGVEAAQQGGRAQGAPATPPAVRTQSDAAGEPLQERRAELALLRDSLVHGGSEP
jgi:hypothetical protein